MKNFEKIREFFKNRRNNPNDNLVLSELQKTENFVSENFSKVPEQGSDRLFQKRASNGKLVIIRCFRAVVRTVTYRTAYDSNRYVPYDQRNHFFEVREAEIVRKSISLETYGTDP